MKIFLIDFENVKSKGLSGIDMLESDDTVIILYSENSDTISFEMHRKVMKCRADIEYFKVHVGGKNALDFQLSTLLGYIVARGEHSHAFIISNDRGFDFLHDFWHGNYVEGIRTVVYRTRNISQALNYAQGSAATVKADEPDDESEQASAPVIEEDVFEPSESLIESIDEQKEQKAEEEPEPDPKTDVKPKTRTPRPRGYMPNLTHILQEVCTAEQIQQISELLSESETKEELHNSLAKIYKQQATDFYKLIRPRYLRLKQLYLKENPGQVSDEPENKTADEPVNVEASAPVPDKLTSLILDNVDAEFESEADRIRKCVLAAQTKQQFYIRMVKEFGKTTGCRIYKGIKNSCEQLLEAARECEG